MATITATVRENLIGIYMGMFKKAPGADAVSEMVVMWEANKTQKQIAAELAKKAAFTAEYPQLQLPAEFADEVVAWLASEATSAGKSWATNWIIGKVNAGISKSDIIVEAVLALRVATNTTDFGLAKANLNNKVEVGVHYAVTKDLKADSAEAIANVTSAASTVTTAKATVDTQAANATGQTFNLTSAANTITGTAGNDTINGVLSGTAANVTLNGLDVIDGGAGTDTLTILDETGAQTLPATLQVSNVETVNVRSAGTASINLTGAGISGVTTLNSTQSVAATLTAATTTDINVSGATGAITLEGGKNISVSDASTGNAINIGGTTVNAGTITVTDTKVGAADIIVDGGTNVTVTATGSSGGANVITVGNGGAATDLPSGTVSVTSNHTGVAATDVALSAITVKGGTTVTVTQTADTSKAASDTTGATLTQGNVTVVAGNTTTAVTVTQASSVTEVVGVTAVAGVTETASVKFGALKSGDKLIIGGNGDATLDAGELQFTAAKDLTAAEAAQAFANLLNPDTQGSAPASNGTYQINGTTAFTTWTSGAVSTDTVVFTSTTASSNVGNLVFNLAGTGTAPTVTTTDGSAATAAKTGVLGVANGTVTIDENATASVTSVTVSGYGNASTIGNTTSLTKLATLSLANSGSTGTAGETDASMTVDAAGVATLNMTINNIKGAVSLDGAADSALKTLNLTVTGADSSFALTAAAVETLAISGDKAATLSTGTFTALKTITVSGSAGATFDGDEADTLTSVNTSATTGSVTATIDGTKATYTGGAGKDTVTLATGTALTKAISLGAGDDTLSFGALLVTGSTATLSGGDGTDTLSMSTAAAAALDGSAQSFYTGFERLTINDAAASETIDLANLGLTSYVTTTGSTGTLTLNNLANNGTVVITTAPTTGFTVGIKDAATGTADVLNATISSAAAVAAGVLTVANVETINLTSTDTNTTAHTNTLTLTAAAAKAVTVTGNAALTLTMTGSTAVTSIDGSAMTAALSVTSLNTTSATTIKGGSGADTLTAATGSTADVLQGGAGNDILTANAGLSTLTGGAGRDSFVIGTASINVNSYSTVTDLTSDDVLQLSGATSFKASKITLGETAVFQDYANAAINDLAVGGSAWFQYGGNTYVVADLGVNGTSFTNGEDLIVRLTGNIDLTNASFDSTIGTIAL